ncbi:hypothetical protein BT96DRAFT_892974, partial [Gymnopus androsaceus JB14]
MWSLKHPVTRYHLNLSHFDIDFGGCSSSLKVNLSPGFPLNIGVEFLIRSKYSLFPPDAQNHAVQLDTTHFVYGTHWHSVWSDIQEKMVHFPSSVAPPPPPSSMAHPPLPSSLALACQPSSMILPAQSWFSIPPTQPASSALPALPKFSTMRSTSLTDTDHTVLGVLGNELTVAQERTSDIDDMSQYEFSELWNSHVGLKPGFHQENYINSPGQDFDGEYSVSGIGGEYLVGGSSDGVDDFVHTNSQAYNVPREGDKVNSLPSESILISGQGVVASSSTSTSGSSRMDASTSARSLLFIASPPYDSAQNILPDDSGATTQSHVPAFLAS